MSGTLRIGLFALAAGALFAAALGIGRAVGPLERGDADEPAHAGGAVAGDAMAGAAADGLAISAGGLRLVPETTTLPAGTAAPFVFRIVDEDGSPVREYDLLHARRMHLVVARRDLGAFLHLHPVRRVDGAWTVPLRLPSAGAYRAFADFSAAGTRAVLGADLTAAGSWTPESLPAPAPETVVDGYRVSLAAPELRSGEPQALRFRLERGGAPVDPQPYLGARGHLVVLREGDLGYLHTHPEEGATEGIEFETTFPSAGRYRAFLQFRAGGAVHTAAFTLEVPR